MVELKKNLRVTKAALRENAIHEGGHAAIGAHLGVITPNGRTKLWVGGRGRHGIGMNTWFGAVNLGSGERELMLVALLAGEAAQFKSLPKFALKGWDSDFATVWADAKASRSQWDRDEIRKLLRGYSDDGKQLQCLTKCTEGTLSRRSALACHSQSRSVSTRNTTLQLRQQADHQHGREA
jgi:hypothetical protein